MRVHLTITAKGQVTLRKSVLDHLGIKPGDKVGVSLLPQGKVELSAPSRSANIRSMRGILRRPGQRAASLEDMQRAIEGGRRR